MKRTGLLVLAAVALCLLLGCGKKPTQADDGPKGFLSVVSYPTGAYVTIDGRETGKQAPHLFTVSAGQYGTIHEVAAHIPHYTSKKDSVYVFENDTTEVTFWLQVVPSTLHINTVPSGATVFVRGEYKGTTPFDVTGLTSYSYDQEIWLRLSNYFPHYGVFETDSILGDYSWDITLNPCPEYTFLYTSGVSLLQADLSGINPVIIASHDAATTTQPCWTANRQLFAYCTQKEIVVKFADGSLKKSIPVPEGSRAYDISWSHDGRYLVWGQYTSGIWRYDANTDEVKRIVQTIGFKYDHNPVYSPDDQWIAYYNHRWETQCVIRLLKADGSEGRDLTSTFRTTYDQYLNLRWANNSTLLFADKQLVIPQSGTAEPTAMDFGGTIIGVSPDGTQLAYAKEGKTHLVDIPSWSDVATIDVPAGYNSIVWIPEHRALMSFIHGAIYWITPEYVVHRIF